MREESESERDSEFQSRETDSSEDEAGSEKEPELFRRVIYFKDFYSI